jgi:predicted heme/steroid binding protein
MGVEVGIALLVVLIVVYFLLKSYTKQATGRLYTPPKANRPNTISPSQLRKYDKTASKRYIALCGKVYDVTASENYAAGGAYESFPGHDATVALARMSLDPSLLDVPMESARLDVGQERAARDWAVRFDEKYPAVGVLETSKKDD